MAGCVLDSRIAPRKCAEISGLFALWFAVGGSVGGQVASVVLF